MKDEKKPVPTSDMEHELDEFIHALLNDEDIPSDVYNLDIPVYYNSIEENKQPKAVKGVRAMPLASTPMKSAAKKMPLASRPMKSAEKK